MTAERRKLIFFFLVVALILASQIVLIGINFHRWTSDWARLHDPQPLPDSTTWPQPIRALSSAMEEAGLDVSQVEVYRLDEMPDERAVVRLPDSEATLNFLSEQLELKPIESLHQGTQWSIGRLPDDWWIAKDRAGPFLASPRYHTGEEADQYVVARDEARRQIFVWYYFNF